MNYEWDIRERGMFVDITPPGFVGIVALDTPAWPERQPPEKTPEQAKRVEAELKKAREKNKDHKELRAKMKHIYGKMPDRGDQGR